MRAHRIPQNKRYHPRERQYPKTPEHRKRNDIYPSGKSGIWLHENAHTLILQFHWHIYSARRFLHAFRLYLLPSYGESLLIVNNLLRNMCVSGLGGLSDTLDYLVMSLWYTNVSIVANAFEELNLVASEKIREMGFELAEAFESLRHDDMVQIFKIDPTRLENVVFIANDLKTILNEWVTKYSQI